MVQQLKSQKYEICVCCGKQLDIPCMTPISNREYYIIGAGQLCQECYFTLNETQTDGGLIMSENQMEYLIDRCRGK